MAFSAEVRAKYNLPRRVSKTKLYMIYFNMLSRCYREGEDAYKNHGQRGIKVCNAWREQFGEFWVWALDHGYKEGLSLDRIDNDRDYEPANCQWISRSLQAANRRCNGRITVGYQTKNYKEWATYFGVPVGLLYYRMTRKGMSLLEARLDILNNYKPLPQRKRGPALFSGKTLKEWSILLGYCQIYISKLAYKYGSYEAIPVKPGYTPPTA